MRRIYASLPLLALCAGTAGAGFFPKGAFSDDARGLTSAQFLKVPPSARFAALSGGGLSLYGIDSFFLNPAGVFGAGRRDLLLSYEALLEGSYRSSMALSFPARGGIASAGFIYNSYSPGLDAVDAAGGAGGQIAAYDAALAAGWARRLPWADFGVALKYIRSRLADASGGTAALDAGLIFRESRGSRTEVGLGARNFGPPLKLGSEAAPLPFELAAGLKWKYAADFNILAEGRLPCDHSPYLVFAGELYLPYSGRSGLYLRSGLNFKNYDDHGVMGAFAGGVGLRSGDLTFDYAFSPYGELGSAHRVTAGYAWGGTPLPEAPSSKRPLPPAPLLVVAPFSAGQGTTETQAAVMRNLVESELLKTKAFRLVEREKLDFILEEKRLAYAGLAGGQAAAEMGKAAGAGLAVFGTLGTDKKGYLATVSLYDVYSGEVLRTASTEASEDYLFREAARRLAAELAR
ncbi:MAG: hypothetical protein M0011_12205 [Elusimicrobia bacterium]|nr:hypothetical protein [Elusimicrobiota bacterium]